jgi:7,8-dihydropterin-6-yl-methyl-4-(beta-D-ribofuranosyl)aminobenzene 5'-phosphate synthase
MTTIPLLEVQKAEVTILVDNYTDLLLGDTGTVKRLRIPPPDAPLAEHGLAYLVTVFGADGKHTILMDAGISGLCLHHNAALLKSSLSAQFGVVTHSLEDIECVVLSHGHFDHFGGLPQFLNKTGKQVPLLVHPGAFAARRIKLVPEFHMDMPVLKEETLRAGGAMIEKRGQASTFAGGNIVLSGTVARTTSFETGSPVLETQQDGAWRQDPFEDDQAIAFYLKDRGLVVLGGCSHAGIINTIEHFRAITGIERVHAVLGGFHLSGAGEALIEPTLAAMQKIAPDLLVPTHCTGWKAINAFEAAMPEAFVLNTVGTTYLFGEH